MSVDDWNKTKTFLGILMYFGIMALSYVITLGAVRWYASIFAEPDSWYWEISYVTESPNASRYHYSENCKYLKQSTFDIELMEVDEAEDMDLLPCKSCLRESAKHKYDDSIAGLSVLTLWLLFGLIAYMEILLKKYKFRNPIVKR